MISPCTSGICSLSSSSFSDLHSSDDEVFRKTDISNFTSPESRQRYVSHVIQRHQSEQSIETLSGVTRPWCSTPNLLHRSVLLLHTPRMSLSDGSNLHDPRQIIIVPKPRRKISPGSERFVDMFSVSRPCLLRSLSGDGYTGRWNWTLDEWSVWDSRPPERSRSAEQLRHLPYCVS